jgi:hypothetical protein
MKQQGSVLLIVLLILGAAIMTQVSLAYVYPAECHTICDNPIQAPCPPGSCRIGAPRAGFPFPVIRDQGGSSPTTGWGKIGPEDYFPPDFMGFVGNLIVYTLLLAFAWETFLVLRKQRSLQSLLIKSPLLIIGMGALIYGFIRDSSDPLVPVRDTGNPQAALLGNWQGTDAVGNNFIFRFYDSGQFSIVPTNRESYGGDYTWVNDKTIQIRLGSSGYVPYEYCQAVPMFFQEYCTTEIIEPFDPSAYPGPVQPILMPYPVPTEAPKEVARVEAVFLIDISEDSMTLTPLSGSPQDFQRVTSY